MAEIIFEGLDEFGQAMLKRANPAKRRQLLQKHGSKLKKAAIGHAQFGRGYSTGATRQSISLKVGGDQAEVEAGTHYSGYLEVGTRKMSAQPFMQPALDDVVPGLLEDLGRMGDD